MSQVVNMLRCAPRNGSTGNDTSRLIVPRVRTGMGAIRSLLDLITAAMELDLGTTSCYRGRNHVD